MLQDAGVEPSKDKEPESIESQKNQDQDQVLYSDMPKGLTYQRMLVWKSHKADELLLEIKELKEQMKRRVVPKSNLELLQTPENLKVYDWIRGLPDDETSIQMIEYAYKRGLISDEFSRDLFMVGSPFYLPLAKKWGDQIFVEKKTKIEVEISKMEKKLEQIKESIADSTRVLQDELLKIEKEKTKKITSYRCDIDSLTKDIKKLREERRVQIKEFNKLNTQLKVLPEKLKRFEMWLRLNEHDEWLRLFFPKPMVDSKTIPEPVENSDPEDSDPIEVKEGDTHE